MVESVIDTSTNHSHLLPPILPLFLVREKIKLRAGLEQAVQKDFCTTKKVLISKQRAVILFALAKIPFPA